MTIFRVTGAGLFHGPGITAPCAIGRSGMIAVTLKREGDGATPIGIWPLRRALFRPDREPVPDAALPCAPIAAQDGWCDAPADPAYNRPVSLPYPASAESMWRDDHLYDLVIVLGHNDDPVVPGAGSCIFLHLAHQDGRGTEGCIAIGRDAMLQVLAQAAPGDALQISP